jgi:hypothetical protein
VHIARYHIGFDAVIPRPTDSLVAAAPEPAFICSARIVTKLLLIKNLHNVLITMGIVVICGHFLSLVGGYVPANMEPRI